LAEAGVVGGANDFGWMRFCYGNDGDIGGWAVGAAGGIGDAALNPVQIFEDGGKRTRHVGNVSTPASRACAPEAPVALE
jgi:hypothetical protein